MQRRLSAEQLGRVVQARYTEEDMQGLMGGWWDEVWSEQHGEGDGRRRLGRRRMGGEQVRVVLGLGAGTQSAAGLVGEGELYVPVDKVEWVFSGAAGVWVQNLVLDLEGLTPEEMWGQLSRLVWQGWGVELGGQQATVLVWLSPPCTSFSKADSSNKNRRDRQGGGVGTGITRGRRGLP